MKEWPHATVDMKSHLRIKRNTVANRLLYSPEAQTALLRGFGKLADTMSVALGPRGRLVAVERENRRREPELLNDGATIARRFLGLPNCFETMGAFLARHIAWQVEEAVGDGATTAVVIARSIIEETMRLRAAGHNVMRLRRGVEKGLAVALDTLEGMSQPLDDPAQIAALGASITGDATLGKYIEEIFDVVGPYGAVDVRTHFGRGHNVRYINGTFWNQGWVSSYFATEGGKATVKNPYLLLTNRHLTSAGELLPILEQISHVNAGQGASSLASSEIENDDALAGDSANHADQRRGLVVIATNITQDALNILVTNFTRGSLPVLAIKAPGLGPEKAEILQDLAVMTGGSVFLADAGDRIEHATLADLGQAREVQAIRSGFTMLGGKGRPAHMRKRSQELRSRIPQAAYGRERNRLIERAGKLLGGIALLEIGSATETEREYLKDRAREAVHVVRLGLQNGVAPGGGIAFLRCSDAINALELPSQEAPGAAILRKALAAPLRAILVNSGLEPSAIMAQIAARNHTAVYDVLREELIPIAACNEDNKECKDQTGIPHIVDPVQVLKEALRVGVSGAIMALTTDVLVHRPRENRDENVDFRP